MTHARSATESLTIGELALQTGVSAETIRYYEREGVVPRAVRGGAGHYRRYVEADAERLRFVRRARDLGFSLDEVRELLALADSSPTRACTDVDRIARTHLAQVDAKLAQLSALRVELDRVIGECDGEVPLSDCQILGALSGELQLSSPIEHAVPESGRRSREGARSAKRKR